MKGFPSLLALVALAAACSDEGPTDLPDDDRALSGQALGVGGSGWISVIAPRD